MKANKSSDLSSISVLPPHLRRSSAVATGSESSICGKNQASASQLRSQQSQQSFSQGVSSQHGLFSQLSQNSLDDVITNDQRLGSQERESSAKRTSCLPPINYPRDESQLQIPRSTPNSVRKWSVPEYKCQISEDLEHRIGMMETSLSRFGMILDSVQSDIMQANKGTKEVALAMESTRQKIIVHEDLLQSMNKGQEDIKVSFEGNLKALSDRFRQSSFQESSKEISLVFSALPAKIETCILKLQNDLIKTFTSEIQAMGCSLRVPNQNIATTAVHPPKGITQHVTSQEMQYRKSIPLPSKVRQTTSVPKIEVGGWKSVKHEQATLDNRNPNKRSNKKRVSPPQMEKERRVIIESDEDIDEGFSCLLKEKERDIGTYMIEDTRQETERILRKARRRKRKYSNPIIID